MLDVIHIAAAIGSFWRLTELIMQDRVTLRLRQWFPSYLWTCLRCVSFWAGLMATALYVYRPILNWPLALSMLYIWHAKAISEKPRQITLLVHANGDIELKRVDAAPSEVIGILTQATRALVTQTAQATGQ